MNLISSLDFLPNDPRIHFYIFLVHGGFHTQLLREFRDNLYELTERIGPHAVIVEGLNEELVLGQVSHMYFGDDPAAFYSVIPAVMITDAHPTTLTEDSLRILVSLQKVTEKFGSFDAFLTLLTRFVRDHDPQFLDLLENSLVQLIAGMLELKPNFCGIGINLNQVITHWSTRRESLGRDARLHG